MTAESDVNKIVKAQFYSKKRRGIVAEVGTAKAKIVGLFVTHRGQRCGVWQFGARLYEALAGDGSIDWHYAECADFQEFQTATAATKPAVILANFHPSTMPWAAEGLNVDGAVSFSVFHEASRASIAALQDRPFDVLLCPDPTLIASDPGVVAVPRFMPAPIQQLPPAPRVFTIGSFGFGTAGKGFEKLCALVNTQCNEARIRINIPPHDDPAMVSPEHVNWIVDACRTAVTRPGIELDITHNFLDEAGLLNFLAENTINAFLYDDNPGRGISSCTDYALAAGRPIAVTRTSMFRHLSGLNPSICVEDRTLTSIAESGTRGLEHYRATYAVAAAGAAWNSAILGALTTRRMARDMPDGRGFNKLLDDCSRAAYVGPLEDLRRLAPDMLDRKIVRANIQQAFALDAARRLAERFAAPRILAIGSFEDTTVASLKALGYQIVEADPQVDGRDLEQFYRDPSAASAFDIVLCVSVLEHVPDDEAFVRQAAALLAPNGIAIFTVDFSERYPETGLRPAADQRLYTQYDLQTRLMNLLPDCALIDPPTWSDGDEDFEYEGCHYAFATWVFTRLPTETMPHSEPIERGLGGPPWKTLLASEQLSYERRLVTQEEDYERRLAMQGDDYERRLAALGDALGAEIKRTERLRIDLKMDDGPRALRAVLPLARVIRSIMNLGRSSPPSGP